MKLPASRGPNSGEVRWSPGEYCILVAPHPDGYNAHYFGTVTGVRDGRVRVRFGQDDVRVLKASELRRAS